MQFIYNIFNTSQHASYQLILKITNLHYYQYHGSIENYSNIKNIYAIFVKI